jgi:hypothetical protein
MKPFIALLLLVSAITVGCSDDPPTAPTPQPLATETISEVTVRARSSACVTFRQEAPGPASASVLGTVPIELGTGTCTSPGAVVGRDARGTLSLVLAVGDYYLRLDHSGNFDFTYRVTLRYLRLV